MSLKRVPPPITYCLVVCLVKLSGPSFFLDKKAFRSKPDVGSVVTMATSTGGKAPLSESETRAQDFALRIAGKTGHQVAQALGRSIC